MRWLLPDFVNDRGPWPDAYLYAAIVLCALLLLLNELWGQL